jgi:hypothetical protein
VEECILRTIRESIPTEAIVRAYLDVSVEQEEEEVFLKDEDDKSTADKQGDNKAAEDKPVEDKPVEAFEAPPSVVPSITNIDDKPIITKLSFNDIDQALNEDGRVEEISAPKTEERLEDISRMRYEQRRAEEEDDDNDRIKISDDVELDLGAMDLGGGSNDTLPIHLDIEEFA